MSTEDKSLLITLFGLNSRELRRAEHLYHTSCKNASIVGTQIMKERRN